MLAEQEPVWPDTKLALNRASYPKFVLEPRLHRIAEDAPAARRSAKSHKQDPAKFTQRFLVEHDVFQIVRGDASFLQTKGYSPRWEASVVLSAAESGFLSSRAKHPY